MTITSLLVRLDHDPHCATRTQAAIQLARRFECHLGGLVATGLVDLPNLPRAAASLVEYSAIAWDALRHQSERLAECFSAECHAAKLGAFDVTIDEADKAESLVRHAHWRDLTLLTQADPGAADVRETQALVESVVLHSARPTLLLPYAGRFDSIGNKVLVAWDDSREAARAISDALPFLRKAREVKVVAWIESGAAHSPSMANGLESTLRWLERHGVKPQGHIEPSTSNIAETILSRASDWDSDLLVMGAYGHSRWTERVLGGATRGLLRSMTVPVLMSH